MLKKEIRKELLDRRLHLADQDLQDRTVMMVYHFNNLPLPAVRYLLSYYPLKERNEFDVTVCEEVVQEHHPAVRIAWPKIDPVLPDMEAHLIEGEKLFAKNRYGILEPIDGKWLSPEMVDIVFVPMIGFDKKGYRVGYGKGFYDRYLPRCRPDTVKLGFCLFEPVEQISDIHQFDVPLDFCITPSRIYEF